MPNNKLLSNLAISSHTAEWWPSVVFVRKSLRTVRTGHPAIIPKYGHRLVRIWYITNGCCLYNTCTASEGIIARKILLENFLEVHEFTKLLEGSKQQFFKSINLGGLSRESASIAYYHLSQIYLENSNIKQSYEMIKKAMLVDKKFPGVKSTLKKINKKRLKMMES